VKFCTPATFRKGGKRARLGGRHGPENWGEGKAREGKRYLFSDHDNHSLHEEEEVRSGERGGEDCAWEGRQTPFVKKERISLRPKGRKAIKKYILWKGAREKGGEKGKTVKVVGRKAKVPHEGHCRIDLQEGERGGDSLAG